MLKAQGTAGGYHCLTPRGWEGETAEVCLSRRRVAVPGVKRIKDLRLWEPWSRDTRDAGSSTSLLD
jgi:hypothetical protein